MKREALMSDNEKEQEKKAKEKDAKEGLSLPDLDQQHNAAKDSEHHEISADHPLYDLNAVYDVPVQVSAVLGTAKMKVDQLLKLGRGAVIELDRKAGEPIDIFVNDRLVARGEIVILEDSLGVTMTELVKAGRS